MSDKPRAKALVKIRNTGGNSDVDSVLTDTIAQCCAEPVSLFGFLVSYRDNLRKAGLQDENDAIFLQDLNDFEGKLYARDDIISTSSGAFRWFRSRGSFAADYIDKMNLRQFHDCAFSVNLVWRRHPDVMQEIGLRNEEELYDYLRKFHQNMTWKMDLRFPGYPVIETGDVDQSSQVRRLMLDHAPITKDHFVRLYAAMYGFSEDYITEHLLKYIEPYLEGDTYQREPVNAAAAEEQSGNTGLNLKRLQDGRISLMQYEVSPDAGRGLCTAPETEPLEKLFDRLNREFPKVDLVCEIEIDDSEYQLLCDYLKRKYLYNSARQYQTDSPDIALTVALVQIAIRNYNGPFWKYVARAVGTAKLYPLDQQWIGKTATNTLAAFGKKILNRHENVNNILIHSFIADPYVESYFDYLFQYYDKDMERSVSEDCQEEAQFICDCMKDPYAKRQQFLSDYTGMSVYAAEPYCRNVVASSLKLIHQTFWNMPVENVDLPVRLYCAFLKWRDTSQAFKESGERSRSGGSSSQRLFRTPHLACDFYHTEFSIVLPRQMLLMQETMDRKVYWKITGPAGERVLRCRLEESYSGCRTEEMVVPVDAEEIFGSYTFSLIDGTQKVRTFDWDPSALRVFNDAGQMIDNAAIPAGECYGYSRLGTDVNSHGVLSRERRNGLVFYHFQFQEGMLLCISEEANYYIGSLPQPGLTGENLLDGVAFRDEDSLFPVYNRLPNLIIGVDEDRFDGTALWVNGNKRRLSQGAFVRIQYGRTTVEHYYYLDLSNYDLQIGINRITVDLPNSRKYFHYEFAYLPGFTFEFEDAPYIFLPRGSLRTSYRINSKGSIFEEKGNPDEPYNFDLEQLETSQLICPLKYQGKTAELVFDVPVLLYSWDGENWSYTRPEDIWHTDLQSVLYLRCPASSVTLVVDDDNGNLNSFSYSKNASGVIVCDLTKLKTYLTGRGQMRKTIFIQKGQYRIDLLRIVMRSYLWDVKLSADYNTGTLTGVFEIAGKNDYYADVYCGEQQLTDKLEIEDRTHMKIPLPDKAAEKSSVYRVEVFEAEDGADDFDDVSYAPVGQKTVRLLTPGNLEGSCLMLKSIHRIQYGKVTDTLELNEKFEYYIRIDTRVDQNTYWGILIRSFDGQRTRDIENVLLVRIRIPDLNDIYSVTVEFLQEEYDEYEPFLYDRYASSMLQNENKRLSASERYRRYSPVLFVDGEEDHYLWDVTYTERQPKLEKLAHAWRAEDHHRVDRRPGSIWTDGR